MTLKEKLEALVRGEKLGSGDDPKEYIHLVNDHVIDESGYGIDLNNIACFDHLFQSKGFNLGPEHVGKRVKLRNGDVVAILGNNHQGVWFVCFREIIFVKPDGTHRADETWDIVEILE